MSKAALSAGLSHLLVAADVLRPGYWADSQIAVCGEVVQPENSPVEGSEEEEEDDPTYCPKCVRAAVRWNMQSVTT